MTSQSSRYTTAILSDIGQRKPTNEDWADLFIPTDPEEESKNGSVFVVADGVGGSAFGEKASQYTARKVLYDYYQSDDPDLGQRLISGVIQANSDIYTHSQDMALDLMGTTLVAAAIRGNEMVVANVGDSRAYLIRGRQIKQVTKDHSLVQQMLDDHQLTEEEARTFKRKNVIMRSVGAESDVDADLFTVNLLDGDIVVLCSDGLHKYFPDPAEMATIIQSESIPMAAKRLVDLANKRGGSDNISVILVQVGQKENQRMAARARIVSSESDETGQNIHHRSNRQRSMKTLLLGLGILLVVGLLITGLYFFVPQNQLVGAKETVTPTILIPTQKPTELPVVPLSTVTPERPQPEPAGPVESPSEGV